LTAETTQLEMIPMNSKSLSAALMAAGLFLAAPAFAQMAPTQKQKTQEGAPATPETASDYKQKTQEGAPAIPESASDYKQRTQSLVPPTNEDLKQK
jgi:hypothetical protein